MMHGGNRWQSLGHFEKPIAQTLIVVHDVEIVDPSPQHSSGPQAERQRLGKGGGAHEPVLEDIDPVPELVTRRTAERVVGSIQVKTRKGGERDPFVEVGIGLPRKDFYSMSELHKGAAHGLRLT